MPNHNSEETIYHPSSADGSVPETRPTAGKTVPDGQRIVANSENNSNSGNSANGVTVDLLFPDLTEPIAELVVAPAPRPIPVIPSYEIACELGRGGMGVVYKARHTGLNRIVALKVLLAGAHAGEKIERFRSEARVIAQIQHPNVIQVFDVGEHNGVSYIAAEFAGGGDLYKWMGGKPVPVMTAVRLVYTLARAVGAAHKKGVVHRDLKPANILLTADGVPKVADFGLAKQFGEAGQTSTGAILGTPYYMSPEQASGQAKRVGPQSDVYSLGVMLYECLAGRVPFSGASVLDTLDQVRFAQPIPVQELRGDIPPKLAVIVRRCLAKVPDERYRNADELAMELARAAAGGLDEPRAKGGTSLLGWTLVMAGTVAALGLSWYLARESGLLERKPATTTPPPPATSPAPKTPPIDMRRPPAP